MYIVLDIETNGLAKDCKILEIAYDIYDKDFQLIDRKSHLLNDGSDTTDYFNKISLERIQKEGIHPKEVLMILDADMQKCTHIIGHNSDSFDIPRIINYSKKYEIELHLPMTQIDTMKISKSYVGLRNSKNQLKYPTLNELYWHLFNKNMDTDESHTGSYDVKITAICFKELMQRNIINI